jgi:hypothetical protein
MSQPLPPEIILQTGQRAFLNPYRGTYTTSRAYAMRMQRNYARGQSQSAARGHGATATGQTEYQVRRQRTYEQYGQTPYQRYSFTFEQRYGFSYSWYRRIYGLYIQPINDMSAASQQWGPEDIAAELANSQYTGHDTDWIEERFAEKLYAMEQYRGGNPQPGHVMFVSRDYISPIEWWYYH